VPKLKITIVRIVGEFNFCVPQQSHTVRYECGGRVHNANLFNMGGLGGNDMPLRQAVFHQNI
jgi:hypothetical protein